MTARNLFVGGWVGIVQDFLQTFDSRPKGANMRYVLWPKAPTCILAEGPDLMRARRAIGVRVPKAPAQICLKLLVLLTHTSTPRLYKWLWQWCVRQSLIIVPSRSPGFYWKWYRSNRTRNMPHTVVPQFWPNLWPSWSWSKLFLPGQSWTNIPI